MIRFAPHRRLGRERSALGPLLCGVVVFPLSHWPSEATRQKVCLSLIRARVGLSLTRYTSPAISWAIGFIPHISNETPTRAITAARSIGWATPSVLQSGFLSHITRTTSEMVPSSCALTSANSISIHKKIPISIVFKARRLFGFLSLSGYRRKEDPRCLRYYCWPLKILQKRSSSPNGSAIICIAVGNTRKCAADVAEEFAGSGRQLI
jgi:hypothetical protein